MNKIGHVLLVDDDQISNFLTATALKKINLSEEITICLDGKEAYKWLQHRVETSCELPDLILLDLNMPSMNGFEFLEAFRDFDKCEKQPVIIILTTSQHYQDIERLKNFPEVEVYLNKPLQEDSLHYLVDKYFSGEEISK